MLKKRFIPKRKLLFYFLSKNNTILYDGGIINFIHTVTDFVINVTNFF